jgi:hypothetical protein
MRTALPMMRAERRNQLTMLTAPLMKPADSATTASVGQESHCATLVVQPKVGSAARPESEDAPSSSSSSSYSAYEKQEAGRADCVAHDKTCQREAGEIEQQDNSCVPVSLFAKPNVSSSHDHVSKKQRCETKTAPDLSVACDDGARHVKAITEVWLIAGDDAPD